MSCSFQSETGPLRKVILKSAQAAFITQSNIDRQWQGLNYTGRPILEEAIKEYSAFKAIFDAHNIIIHWLEESEGLGIDSIYCRDASILTDAGAILCSMGKEARRGEPHALEALYQKLGIPVLGKITGKGKLEGGDSFWLGPHTLAVGRGYRTNAEGIRQLCHLSQGRFEVIEVQLPHYKGPDDVFHLMSIVSPIDKDLLLVYSPLMPVAFRELLLEMKFKLIEVPPVEFETIGINVLALAPKVCLMLEGNPLTQSLLEAEGVKVHCYKGQQISAKGCGGPTCLSRPLERAIL